MWPRRHLPALQNNPIKITVWRWLCFVLLSPLYRPNQNQTCVHNMTWNTYYDLTVFITWSMVYVTYSEELVAEEHWMAQKYLTKCDGCKFKSISSWFFSLVVHGKVWQQPAYNYNPGVLHDSSCKITMLAVVKVKSFKHQSNKWIDKQILAFVKEDFNSVFVGPWTLWDQLDLTRSTARKSDMESSTVIRSSRWFSLSHPYFLNPTTSKLWKGMYMELASIYQPVCYVCFSPMFKVTGFAFCFQPQNQLKAYLSLPLKQQQHQHLAPGRMVCFVNRQYTTTRISVFVG